MVIASDQIYIERDGQIERSGRRFISDDVTESIIERIVAQVGRRIDKSQPLVDARLPDGSRVNAIIPPLAVRGPCLTIRKFPAQRFTMDDLVEIGSITREAAAFLRACVVESANILISGGTGTGKSQGYLIPAALATRAGGLPVVVSTFTACCRINSSSASCLSSSGWSPT